MKTSIAAIAILLLAGCSDRPDLAPATDSFSAPLEALDGERFAASVCAAPHAEWATSCSVTIEGENTQATAGSDCASWHFQRDRKKKLWLLKGYDLCDGSDEYASTVDGMRAFAEASGFTQSN